MSKIERSVEQKFPDSLYKSSVLSYRIRFTVYTNEQESDTKLSQIEYESGTFDSGKVFGDFVSEKI